MLHLGRVACRAGSKVGPVRWLNMADRKIYGIPIILLEDIAALGLKGDIVSVKPGRARNHLVPYHYAAYVTEENLKKYWDMVEESQRRTRYLRKQAGLQEAREAMELEELLTTWDQRYRAGLEEFVANSREEWRQYRAKVLANKTKTASAAAEEGDNQQKRALSLLSKTQRKKLLKKR
jgi:hypothetical protein